VYLGVYIHLYPGSIVERSVTLETVRLLIWTLPLRSYVIFEPHFPHCKMEIYLIATIAMSIK
jgi:hypothetical protein